MRFFIGMNSAALIPPADENLLIMISNFNKKISVIDSLFNFTSLGVYSFSLISIWHCTVLQNLNVGQRMSQRIAANNISYTLRNSVNLQISAFVRLDVRSYCEVCLKHFFGMLASRLRTFICLQYFCQVYANYFRNLLKPAVALQIVGERREKMWSCIAHSFEYQMEEASIRIQTVSRGDQRGGMHTNERSHLKLITIGSNWPYGRR